MLYVLVPVALLLVFVAVIAYVWSVRTGQFDDLQTPAFRPLLDDRPSLRQPPFPSAHPSERPPGSPPDSVPPVS